MTNAPILLIGAGRMGGALLAGWARRGIGPVIAVEPHPSAALKAFAKKHHVALFAHAASIDTVRARACVVALKPQVLKSEAAALRPIAESGALMISIAAGTTSETLRKAWGAKARIVRAMPNLPGTIGRGITALYAGKGAAAKDKRLTDTLLGPLGESIWVYSTPDVDFTTAVSGSGPAYVFLLVEALADAGVALGLARSLAEKLARATITGSAALLDASPLSAAELRRNVTSPGGTTQAALEILMAKDGLSRLMRRAVLAAAKRARQLGS